MAARTQDLVEETKEASTVLGKRKHKDADIASESEEQDKKKHKKHKKDKKSKKDKKDKKSKKSKKQEEEKQESNDEDDARPERWVPPERNPWTGHPFSDRFFDILAKRKELPAWQARKQVLDLVQEY